jgi:hypothetical protein
MTLGSPAALSAARRGDSRGGLEVAAWSMAVPTTFRAGVGFAQGASRDARIHEGPPMISRESIEWLFEHSRKRRREGRAKMEIDGPCRWSYFFIDTSRFRLMDAARHLEQAGYEVKGLLEPRSGDEDMRTIYLRFDRIETHDVETLIVRSDELSALARQLDLDGYDGMEVGAIDGP